MGWDGPSGLISDDLLVDLVRSSTGDRTWDTNPRASMTLRNGLLYVTQTPGVHREIEALLARLAF
jgi:hypothetical protein